MQPQLRGFTAIYTNHTRGHGTGRLKMFGTQSVVCSSETLCQQSIQSYITTNNLNTSNSNRPASQRQDCVKNLDACLQVPVTNSNSTLSKSCYQLHVRLEPLRRSWFVKSLFVCIHCLCWRREASVRCWAFELGDLHHYLLQQLKNLTQCHTMSLFGCAVNTEIKIKGIFQGQLYWAWLTAQGTPPRAPVGRL